MYPYILCFCGRELGAMYMLFKELRARRYAEKYGDDTINPSVLAITDSMSIDISDIFDALHVHLACCRGRLTSQVEFITLY